MTKVKLLTGFSILVLLLCGIVLVGCGEKTTTDDTTLLFGCDSQITIRMGTLDAESASAPLITNSDDEIKLSYNSDIINYDLDTGVITALEAGSTTLLAKVDDKIASVQVVVEKAIYCTSLQVSTTYYLKLNGNKQTEAIIPIANTGYNMGFEFESLSPNIVTVDANGVLTPVSVGEGVIRVKAKNECLGYDYGYITATANVIVEENATQFDIQLLDSNRNPLELIPSEQGYDYYQLNNYNVSDDFYILKITSNIPMNNKYQSLIETHFDGNNDTSSFDFNAELQRYNILSADGKTWYRPFYAVRSGLVYLQISLDDFGLNYFNTLLSNILKINIVEPVTEINIVSSIANNDDTVYLDNGIAEFDIKVDTGNISTEFSITTSADLSYSIEGNTAHIKATKVGNYKITFFILDSCNISKEYNFSVRLKNLGFAINVDKTEIVIEKGSFDVIYFTGIDDTLDSVFVVFLDDEGNEITEPDGINYSLMSNNIYIEGQLEGTYYLKLKNKAGLESQIITILIN